MMKRLRLDAVVIISGGIVALSGAVTSNVAAAIFGCFLMAAIIWGEPA